MEFFAALHYHQYTIGRAKNTTNCQCQAQIVTKILISVAHMKTFRRVFQELKYCSCIAYDSLERLVLIQYEVRWSSVNDTISMYFKKSTDLISISIYLPDMLMCIPQYIEALPRQHHR